MDLVGNASTSLGEPPDSGYLLGNSEMNMPSQELINAYCDLTPPDRRWYMVAVAGTSLSIISLISNLIIARVLLSAKRGHFFFLGLLALSDAFISSMYGPVIAMDIIKERLGYIWLTKIYLWYVGTMLALCHTAMTFSCYLIILGTLERLLITQKAACLPSFRRHRGAWAAFMGGLALIFKGTMYLEVTVLKNPYNCTGTAEYVAGMTKIVENYFYGDIFKFYIRNLATVFVPFLVLAYMNFQIVRTLQQQRHSAEMFRFACSEHKRKVRSATRLLVLVVCGYLVANTLNLFVTAWEYVDMESTQSEDYYEIYEMLTDIISVLFIFTCATRLFVYCSCNKEIRDMVLRYLGGGEKTVKKRYTVSNSQRTRLPSGTPFDRVAVAVARRLMSGGGSEIPLKEEEHSPLHSVVYSNNYTSKDVCQI